MGERPIVEPAAVPTIPEGKVAPIYYISVVVLGLIGLVAIVGGIWLTLAGRDIPDLIVALGSAAVGALAGLLAPTSGGGD
jgi:hypothetical protein